MTRLLLIRHAQADTGAAPGILCGQCDVPLSATGLAQVREMLRRYGGERLADAMYTSPLRRARDTASVLARAWRLPLRIDAGLQEIDCGDLDGHPIVEVEQTHPDLWARNMAQDDETFAWPGGESYRAFRGRVLAAVERITTAHPGSRVALVTHAGVISQLLGVAQGRSAAAWEAGRPRHATVSEMTWDGAGALAVLRFDAAQWC